MYGLFVCYHIINLKDSHIKIHNLFLKSWSSICIPRDLGGLGIRNMYDVNLALITKLGWKLLSDHD
jgi:hypothetical protein